MSARLTRDAYQVLHAIRHERVSAEQIQAQRLKIGYADRYVRQGAATIARLSAAEQSMRSVVEALTDGGAL